MPVPVEACVAADAPEPTRRSCAAAHAGGAATVELCAGMDVGGTTPAPALVRAARAAFPRPGLYVMIRPRGGDFAYGATEQAAMKVAIAHAADAGADGVVFGAVTDGALDVPAMTTLVRTARAHGLRTTCHRAFDAAADPAAALDALLDLGVDRVLTSGTPWGAAAGAPEGTERLAALVARSAGRIEVVVGGGLGPGNVGGVLRALPLNGARVAVHAYGALREEGVTDAARVAAFAAAAFAAAAQEGAAS